MNHRVLIRHGAGEECFDFKTEEKMELFVSDLIDGFNLSEVLDPYSDKYI